MKKSFIKVFWLVLVLFISNSLAHSDSLTILSEQEKELGDDSKVITLEISSKDNPQILIGDKGAFSLVTNFIDSERNIFNNSNIEELTSFNAPFKLNNQKVEYNYNAKCRLWEPINKPINIICKFENNFSNGTYYANLEANFKYKDYSIKIISIEPITIQKLNSPLPLLYSNPQTIEIEEGRESYELIFKIEEYNKELLILESIVQEMLILDECSQKGKELKCIIRKEIIEKVLADNNQTFSLAYKNDDIDNSSLGFIELHSVFDIVVIDDTNKKKDVYASITKILENTVSSNSLIIFETNVTNISDFTGSLFYLIYNLNCELQCFLKKVESNPLIILCYPPSKGDFIIEALDEIRLDNASIKYNFFISQGFPYEKLRISGKGVRAYFVYPKVLNFTLNANYVVDFMFTGGLENVEGIKLNPNSNDLDCNNIGVYIKRCIVPESHFRFEESGHFFIHFLNNNKTYSIFYELAPIYVILPESKDIMIKIIQEKYKTLTIGENGTIIFSTNYNDNEKNIFDDLDIDNYISFKGSIRDYYNSGYNYNPFYDANCKIWKANDGNIRIICDLDRNLIYNRNYIRLEKKITINYKDYKINIYQEESIEVIKDYTIPFLYYDEQIINIDNNDLLYIYGKYNNYEFLDNCKIYGNDLKCSVTKNKLEEILTLSGEQFKIGAMNDNKGLIQFEFVFNITIIYNNTIKEDLFIGLTQIVSAIEGSMGIIYGIETNISSIPNFIATISRTEYFKKTTGRPLIYFFDIDSQYGQGILKNENESIISNMHYKYNFRIQPYDINQTIPIDIYAMGINTINLFYPKKLDFTLEESLIIRYIVSYNELKIKLKPSLPDLECVDLNGMKKCTVSLFDFVGEKSGNYETYYSIYGNKYRIYFKLPTINIILPENRVYIIIEEKLNFTGINIGENGLLYFETNYIDDKDFFDESDIEETIFNTSIIANGNYDYIITCRLWKPSD